MGRVTICGIDTSALPKLNSKECDALLKKIKAGDKEARDLFLRANMRGRQCGSYSQGRADEAFFRSAGGADRYFTGTAL